MGSLVASAFLILSPLILVNTTQADFARQYPNDLVEVPSDLLPQTPSLKTDSYFIDQEETVTEEIPYETEYVKDPEIEWGQEFTQEAGVAGTATKTFLVSYWNGGEVGRTLINEIVEEPKAKVVAQGTKIIWKEVATPDGPIKYWATLNVRATSYDANCVGCTGRTFTGTEVVHGTCATDPSVIPLGNYFYVPGYGMCHAEDIGGAIKGNKIDLGFEDVQYGWWSTRYVDIYLTTGAPY